MCVDIYQVDSFTTELFSGNPAGVCILSEDISETAMKNIAMEMAVSETAFYFPETGRLRWFTPTHEVALCGHGTLAVTWVLYKRGDISANQVVKFETLSGELRAKVCDDVVEMDFPSIKTEEKTTVDKHRINCLGIDEGDIVFYGAAGDKDFIEINCEKKLRALRPDFSGLSNLPGRGAIITSRSMDSPCDFISRYFAPWVGVNEDPVTGSAHCALAHYWGKKLNKSRMTGFQASQRGGFVYAELSGPGRVRLSGSAVISIEGALLTRSSELR